MDNPISVVVDLNVILDVLQNRTLHIKESALVWKAVEKETVSGFLAAHTITTLFYLMRKSTQPTMIVSDVLKVFSVAAVDDVVLQRALALNWTDFEDAVQMAAAEAVNADYLITRNPKDFDGGAVKVLTPAEFIAFL